MILVDTNVLLDVATRDERWALWSLSKLAAAADAGPVLINDIVYAELAVRYGRIEDVDDFIARAGLELRSIPKPALFLAAKAFVAYRKRGGTRTGVLSDFFIGAHAAVEGFSLLTRDARRYRTYFPDVSLVTPEG
ncbi:type II toxin-antitoxin system VapC family toxin [Rhizobium sp. C4]|uniref:type II toxin-antitoxin system VapC family toxin n=1 Tax=Rhizobium sp. C4 TaxID=1349800 RepID=UPI001E640A85|nr:type II toxin-antitoxin system VapC family toxin [Rhizobium sp. C4]MCD2173418.1 type II toxin-antitoxin system VapC family toxin [Rhizobium sp. C4]